MQEMSQFGRNAYPDGESNFISKGSLKSKWVVQFKMVASHWLR